MSERAKVDEPPSTSMQEECPWFAVTERALSDRRLGRRLWLSKRVSIARLGQSFLRQLYQFPISSEGLRIVSQLRQSEVILSIPGSSLFDGWSVSPSGV